MSESQQLIRLLNRAGVDVYTHRNAEHITAIEARGTAHALADVNSILATLTSLTGVEVERQVEEGIMLPNDGYADGGEPYTAEELSGD